STQAMSVINRDPSANVAATSQSNRVELELAERLNIFPNPTRDLLHVAGLTARRAQIEVYNIAGALVLRRESFTEGTTVLDVSKLQSGTYYVRVREDEASHSLRFVKQ
ncbi:MAG: T9SS type A sorting domain-containing protein, partial [Bacteroidota bacterium]